MLNQRKTAAELHCHVPQDYYERSIRVNPLQRFWHFQRFAQIAKICPSVKGRVLDIGSADGTFSKVIVDKTGAKKLLGIDINKPSVDYANQRFKTDKRLHFRVGDAIALPFGTETFEAVFCLEALEHIYSPLKAIKEMKRVLKKNGYVVLLVPTDSLLFRIVWSVVLKTWGKHWQDTHVNSFTKDKLLVLLKKVGFLVELNYTFLWGMLRVVRARKVA